MLLFLHSLSHLLVDAACAATLFGPVRELGDLTSLLLLYNTLAFSAQCLAGLAADRLRRLRGWAAGAMLCVAAGFLLPLPALARVLLIGLGNCVFHVAAGTETLRNSNGRAAPLGLFVAPGALGLSLGTLFPALGPVFAGLLLAGAIVSLFVKTAPSENRAASPPPGAGPPGRREIAAALLLTAAVAVRAVGGSAVSFPWQSTTLAALVTTACVFGGKAAGGFLCDRIGPTRAAWVSVPLAALLITFCCAWALPSLLGQLALNLSMPVTLWLMYRALPDQPGFSFGLAASALWPGTYLGLLLNESALPPQPFVLLSFLFGLAAILWAASSIRGAAGKSQFRIPSEWKQIKNQNKKE